MIILKKQYTQGGFFLEQKPGEVHFTIVNPFGEFPEDRAVLGSNFATKLNAKIDEFIEAQKTVGFEDPKEALALALQELRPEIGYVEAVEQDLGFEGGGEKGVGEDGSSGAKLLRV